MRNNRRTFRCSSKVNMIFTPFASEHHMCTLNSFKVASNFMKILPSRPWVTATVSVCVYTLSKFVNVFRIFCFQTIEDQIFPTFFFVIFCFNFYLKQQQKKLNLTRDKKRRKKSDSIHSFRPRWSPRRISMKSWFALHTYTRARVLGNHLHCPAP